MVIGAGPGGLAAAWELSGLGYKAVVLEQDSIVGGIARTVNYRGYRFDIGGHRFFSKVSRVREMWEELLGDDFLERERMSRIYYGGRFFHYPLRPMSALLSLGPFEAARVGASYAAARLAPIRDERTFERSVQQRPAGPNGAVVSFQCNFVPVDLSEADARKYWTDHNTEVLNALRAVLEQR